jgi:hypothetical protein
MKESPLIKRLVLSNLRVDKVKSKPILDKPPNSCGEMAINEQINDPPEFSCTTDKDRNYSILSLQKFLSVLIPSDRPVSDLLTRLTL